MTSSINHHSNHSALCSSCELSHLNLDFREKGTRFKLFPQSPQLTDYQQPETVWISLEPEKISSGPSDSRMYVVDAKNKEHYEDPYLPPFRGDSYPPAVANSDGHFDHLEVGTQQFEAAHMYGTLRWVLDIWETYFNRQIDWCFKEHYDRLELVPWLEWDNAHAGYGFIEMGYGLDDEGQKFPYNLNFDVLAHEFGHTLLYSVIGMPDDNRATAEFFAFHETCSDMIAVVSMLHFNSVLDRLLDDSCGNLYTPNELNRIGEESNTRQIRMASNDIRIQDVADLNTPLDQLSFKQIHDMSLPLTGALFDLLVEVFQHNLVDDGLISNELDLLSRGAQENEPDGERIQILFEQFYREDSEGFKKALVDARDYIGLLLSSSCEQLSWDLTFQSVVNSLLQSDLELTSGHYQHELEEVFEWRGI